MDIIVKLTHKLIIKKVLLELSILVNLDFLHLIGHTNIFL